LTLGLAQTIVSLRAMTINHGFFGAIAAKVRVQKKSPTAGAAARAGERVRRAISEELAFLNLIQCKRHGKPTLAKPNGSWR
jgi:hypothetical protein